MPKKQPRLLRVTADDEGGFPTNIVAQFERESGTGSIITVMRGDIEYHRARYTIVDELGVKRAKYVYGKSYAEAEKKICAALRAPSNEIGKTTTVAQFMKIGSRASRRRTVCRPIASTKRHTAYTSTPSSGK
jgi:hypothetical protein